jgi:Domain of unknown function (DU1801)
MTQATAAARQQLDAFIAKFDAVNQAAIRKVRAALRKRYPSAHELVWDNYNFFVIAFSPTDRPSDAILSLAADANGLTLFFLHGTKLPDPKKILQGAGKQVRSVRLGTPAILDLPEVRALMDAATANAKPMPEQGSGTLVIRGISHKQRPRKKAPARAKGR